MRPGGCGRGPAHLAAQRLGSARRVAAGSGAARGGAGSALTYGRWPLPRRGAGRARQGADGGAWVCLGAGSLRREGKERKLEAETNARSLPLPPLDPTPRPPEDCPSWKNDGYDRTVPRAHLGTSKAGWCPPFNDMPRPIHLGFPPPPSAEPHWGRWSCVGPAHPPPSPASLRGGRPLYSYVFAKIPPSEML